MVLKKKVPPAPQGTRRREGRAGAGALGAPPTGRVKKFAPERNRKSEVRFGANMLSPAAKSFPPWRSPARPPGLGDHFRPELPPGTGPAGVARVHTWTGASSDQQGLSSSGKLLHCTLEFNEPLRGSLSGLPTFSFLSERCCVRAHLFSPPPTPTTTVTRTPPPSH